MTVKMLPSPRLASAGADFAWLLLCRVFGILPSSDLKSVPLRNTVEAEAAPGTWFFRKFKYASYLWAESVHPVGNWAWHVCVVRLAGLQPVTAFCLEATLARSCARSAYRRVGMPSRGIKPINLMDFCMVPPRKLRKAGAPRADADRNGMYHEVS